LYFVIFLANYITIVQNVLKLFKLLVLGQNQPI
jgi:hypothetical protein